MKQSFYIFLAVTALLVGFSSCDVPSNPINPNPSAIPSESPDSLPCERQLQCMVDNTSDNGVRKEAQEALNQMALTPEPGFTQICEREAGRLISRVSECRNR